MVPLLDAGVLHGPHAARRLRAVFSVRGAPVPTSLPNPPAAWRDDYAAIVGRLGHELPSYDEALVQARALFARLVQADHPR